MGLTRKKPLPRSTKPIPKKRATPRKYRSPRCKYETPTGRRPCKKPQDVKWYDRVSTRIGDGSWHLGWATEVDIPHGLCRPHAHQEALVRWSFFIRTRGGFVCELSAWHQSLGVKCGGNIVGCHGFGKGAYPAVMFEEWNGFSGCSGINNWTDNHPLEWTDYLKEKWGNALYEERKREALAVRKYDLADVLARYPKKQETE